MLTSSWFQKNCVYSLRDVSNYYTLSIFINQTKSTFFSRDKIDATRVTREIVPRKTLRRGNSRAVALRTWQPPLPPLRTSPPDSWTGKNGGAPSESLAARVSRSPGPVGALRISYTVEVRCVSRHRDERKERERERKRDASSGSLRFVRHVCVCVCISLSLSRPNSSARLSFARASSLKRKNKKKKRETSRKQRKRSLVIGSDLTLLRAREKRRRSRRSL